jgi:hypothetical protein
VSAVDENMQKFFVDFMEDIFSPSLEVDIKVLIFKKDLLTP